MKWATLFLKRGEPKRERPPRRRIDLGLSRPIYPIYAIGDVHGCLDQLKDAEHRIYADMAATKRQGLVVLLGDYVDRGPQSKEVLDHLIEPSELGLRRLPLCGNHDDLFTRYLMDPDGHSEWLGVGGEQTLMSYGIDLLTLDRRSSRRREQLAGLLREAVPHTHRQFLANLPVSLGIGDMVFVHAGIRPSIPLDEQTDEDLMWIREPFLTEGPHLPLVVIHGHTPTAEPDLGQGRIGIDTGAYYTGKLAVLKIDSGRFKTL